MSQPDKFPLVCPSCSAEVPAHLVAKFMDQYRLVLKLTPHPGTLMEARVLAKSITAIDGMLREVAKSLGQRVLVNIEKLVTTDAGEVEVHTIVAGIPSRTTP